MYNDYQISYSHGYAILDFSLNPLQYNPKDGTLVCYSQMTVIINLQDTNYVDQFFSNNPSDEAYVKTLVSNPDITNLYQTADLPTFEYPGGLCDPSQHFDYVIITTTQNGLDYWDIGGTLHYNWNSLIAKHNGDGLSSTVVTVQQINACSDYFNATSLFNGSQAHIREFCKDAYQDWETRYVLIAGDADTIPARQLYYQFEGNVDSDLYWSNLDNDFNSDHDSQWGEAGDSGFDVYSEIYIGRITCDVPQDVSNWLTKSFYYADSLDSNYFDNAAFYGGDTGWPTEGDDLIDYSAIKGTNNWLGPSPGANGPFPTWAGFQYGFETWNTVNPNDQFDLSVKWTAEPPNPGGWQGGSTSAAITGLKNAINNDTVTLLSGIAHANVQMSLDVSASAWESQYTNTKPFFLHDYGTHCGDFNAADDGVIESMLFRSDTKLAFACIYNTGYGWGQFDDTNSSSAFQQKEFWDYFFDLENHSGTPGNWQLGKGQAWSKDRMAATINWDSSSGSWRGVIECCLLFGDPAQTLKIHPTVMNETTSTTHALFETIVSQNATVNASFIGDFNGTMNFTSFKLVLVNSGLFEGKGFYQGNWSANIESILREGYSQGFAFKMPGERKIYLKGEVGGDVTGVVDGYLNESVNGSGVYDHYQASWQINRIGGYFVFAQIAVNGTLYYQDSSNYSSELYVLQSLFEGVAPGTYNRSLSITITHVRINNETNPYYGEGFSIISYVTDFGSGDGWTYNHLVSENVSQLNGVFTDPLAGIVSGVLNESGESRTLAISIERLDIGLPPRVDLKVRVWGPQRVSPGQTVDYIIEYRNDGLKVADRVMVFNILDSLVNITSASAGVIYDDYYHELAWNLNTIPPKTIGYLSVTGVVNWGLPQGTILANSAYINEMSNTETHNRNIPSSREPCDYPTGKILYLNGINCKENSVDRLASEKFISRKAQMYGKEGIWDPIYTKGWESDWKDVLAAENNEPTDNNGLKNPNIINACYDVVYAYSGGTRTAVTAALHYNLRCKKLVLMSPIKGFTDLEIYISDLETILNNGNVEEIVIYQSTKDKLPLQYGYMYQAKLDPNDPWIDERIKINPINSLMHEEWPHWVLNFQLNTLEKQSSFASTAVVIARDPNIKYGIEGIVFPNQKLNYTIEYENEGEGIAFGAYFTDTLDEDLNDSSLEIGPVINTTNGSVIAPPGYYNPNTRTITWFVGEVSPGEGGYTNISVNVSSEVIETEIINYATVYFPSIPEETRTNGVISIVDIIPPRYSQAGQNKSIVTTGDTVRVYAYWKDGGQLNYTWLETNESGAWVNKSYVRIWNEGWSNFTIQPTRTGLIGWRIHANDTAGNENATPMFCFEALPSPPIAAFTYSPRLPGAGEIITFNASQSWDPDGFITNYQWDFGDENVTNTLNPIITHTYNSVGDFSVTLTVTDNEENEDNITKIISVVDTTLPPEIIDNTLSTGTTGDSFTFNATVTDNTQVASVWVEYWYGTGTHTNVSMTNVAGNFWQKTIVIPHSVNPLHYIIAANDTSDNWNTTDTKNVTIHDNDDPEITNVQAVPSVQMEDGFVNISAIVTDNIEVNQVYLTINYPNNIMKSYSSKRSTIENFSITQNKTSDTYYCNKTYYQFGVYTYHIWANDTSGNGNHSVNYTFEIVNQPPYTPDDPQPADGAINISIQIILNWTGGDPDFNDTVSYDVYFGTTSPPPQVVSNQTSNSYNPSELDYSTTYYWRIVAWDNHGASTPGPIWHFTTVLDTTPPVTSISFEGTMGNNGWYISPVLVSFTATDSQSGVTSTMYKIDSGSWTTYSAPFVVSADGNHTVSYYSIDKVGNMETSKTANLKIDKTQPSITLTKQQIDLFNVKFTAQVSDETSGIDRVEFALDGVLQYNDTQSPYEWTWTGLGDHTVTATAFDFAGNSQSQSMSTPVEQIQGFKTVQLRMIQLLMELGFRKQSLT